MVASPPLDLQCEWLSMCDSSRLKGTMKRIQPLLIAISLFACVLGTLTPLTLRAQERTTTATPNTVWVGADGKYEAEPDTAVMQFDISAQEDNLQAANARATKAAEQVRQLLRSNNLDPKQAQ